MTSPGYLRYPHINGDLVVFVAADDVWLAPVGRRPGLAVHRRSGASHARPGSRPTARTWRGPAARTAAPRSTWPAWPTARAPGCRTGAPSWAGVCGWTRDGEVLAVSAAGSAVRALHLGASARHRDIRRARAASECCRSARWLTCRPVGARPDGSVALLNGPWGGSGDPAHWKRYRGGTAGRLLGRPGGRPAVPAAVPPRAGRPARPVRQPDDRRRPARVPVRSRGHRQRVLVRAGRHRPAPSH